MVEITHPVVYLFVWVGAQIVCGILGYRYGYERAELAWRRYVMSHEFGEYVKRTADRAGTYAVVKAAARAVGFKQDDSEEAPDTLRSNR